MTLSDEELQKYVGRSFQDAKKELEGLGYLVHDVRIGQCSTGSLPQRCFVVGEPMPEQQKRAILTYNGDDPEHKVTNVRQDLY